MGWRHMSERLWGPRCSPTGSLLFSVTRLQSARVEALTRMRFHSAKEPSFYEAGDELHEVYFPLSCVLAPQLPRDDGTMMATTLRGSEEAWGLLTAVRKARAPGHGRVQIGGRALRIVARELRKIFHQNMEVGDLFLSYWDAVMHQYEQTLGLGAKRKSMALTLIRDLQGSTAGKTENI